MAREVEFKGFEEMRRAVLRSPQRVRQEVQNYLVRGLATYRRTIYNNPWRMGMAGGGAPVRSGHLRATHQQEIRPWEARIYPTAPYAAFVHGIKGHPRRRTYQLRPWLDYAMQANEAQVRMLENDMMKNIVADLAR